jgi:hypothetical protein
MIRHATLKLQLQQFLLTCGREERVWDYDCRILRARRVPAVYEKMYRDSSRVSATLELPVMQKFLTTFATSGCIIS